MVLLLLLKHLTLSFNNNNNNTRGNVINTVNRRTNPNLNCKNCGRIGRNIERCYELFGFPHGFKRFFNTVKQSFNANVDIKHNEK